jgi:hypothetical protein
MLFTVDDPTTPAKTTRARKIIEGLQRGTIDRSLFTSNANAYFSDAALKDFASGLEPLGALQEFTQTARGLRGGMIYRTIGQSSLSKLFAHGPMKCPMES